MVLRFTIPSKNKRPRFATFCFLSITFPDKNIPGSQMNMVINKKASLLTADFANSILSVFKASAYLAYVSIGSYHDQLV